MSSAFRYYNGLPAKIWHYRLLIFVHPLLYLHLGLVVLMAWCIAENFRWVFRGLELQPLMLLVLDLAAMFYLTRTLWAAIQRLTDAGRIVPYFRKPNTRNISRETFLAGAAISAHCEALDLLAAKNNLVPISHFGFMDDGLRQTVEWHDPAEGLRTVTGLIETLGDRGFYSEEEIALILSDLNKWKSALENARAEQVLFCLIIRLADKWISPIEMDKRMGTFG